MIEAVERTDKAFALGLQFHPEAALVKNLDNAENKGDFMDYDTALSIFRRVLEALPALEEALRTVLCMYKCRQSEDREGGFRRGEGGIQPGDVLGRGAEYSDSGF